MKMDVITVNGRKLNKSIFRQLFLQGNMVNSETFKILNGGLNGA